MNHARVFKKTAPNGKITVYVEKRELLVGDSGVEPLYGVLFVDTNYVKDKRVYGQFVLTFRYGREDEEVMGLRFCNEACLQVVQLWPQVTELSPTTPLTPLQDTLVKRLGPGAGAFTFVINSLAPPSVTLHPARSYMGAPIGTNYDIRIFAGDAVDEKPHKRSSIKMGIKLGQVSTYAPALQPSAVFSRQLLLAEGSVSVEATLDKEIYQRDESLTVAITICNNSNRNVKKIKILVVQFVDVAMFSNGKFKNIVASLVTTDGCPVTPGNFMKTSFTLTPERGSIKNWIALEEFYDREAGLASTVDKPFNGERNVFAIYVSYYVKVKLLTSALGGEVCVKVPFKLMTIRNQLDEVDSQDTADQEKKLPLNCGSPLKSSQSMYEFRLLTYFGSEFTNKPWWKPPFLHFMPVKVDCCQCKWRSEPCMLSESPALVSRLFRDKFSSQTKAAKNDARCISGERQVRVTTSDQTLGSSEYKRDHLDRKVHHSDQTLYLRPSNLEEQSDDKHSSRSCEPESEPEITPRDGTVSEGELTPEVSPLMERRNGREQKKRKKFLFWFRKIHDREKVKVKK